VETVYFKSLVPSYPNCIRSSFIGHLIPVGVANAIGFGEFELDDVCYALS
jgi:hypothetical protein